MKPAAAAPVPLLLAVHGVLGAAIGASAGGILLGTDVIGLAALAQADRVGFVLVPALAALFALGTAASALDLPEAADAGGMMPRRPARRWRAVGLRVAVHGRADRVHG